MWFCPSLTKSNPKIYRCFSFRHLQIDFFQIWYDDGDHRNLHFGTTLDDLDLLFNVTVYMRKLKVLCSFSRNFLDGLWWSLVKCLALLVCWCWCYTSFAQLIFMGKELYICDFINYTFTFVQLPDIYEWICFKLGVMLDKTNVYSNIPVWMTLTFTQGHRLTGKVELG